MSEFTSCCIIDDDELFVFNAKKLMKKNGFCDNILWYTDGQKAIDGLLELLSKNIPLPQIILLDLYMPNKDGWAFLEEFEKIPSKQRGNVKIYISSSFISPENMIKAKSYKTIQQYLVKPLTTNSLDSIISSKKAI